MTRKALVVDDSAIVRNMHMVMLQSEGFDVTAAENGYDGLEKALATDFDLVLVDVNMPRMDGFTFCKELRALSQYRDTPIIIISTEEGEGDKMAGLKAGANLFLIKPIKSSELIANVRILLT
ncbi:MAG: two-component system response regulator [SAR324 cluster bacterium]|uniref:Two-component system response regulator n=1 Tax=SAR324 cluster bacterium TaxID=2024889 RepID=A0A2A4SRK7_9DELT|nr:MAG: two-component system response regulator [SAR324 cluster bacterium]